MTRILHIVRADAAVPDAAVADGDQVVYIAETDSATLCRLIFEFDRVVVW
jgi:hypothetical protein